MLDEIADTIEQLRSRFEAIAIRGIRACGPEDTALLKAAGEEFTRIGAAHLAHRINELVSAVEADDRAASVALLRAQTSLRLFDRVLTLDYAAESVDFLASEEEA